VKGRGQWRILGEETGMIMQEVEKEKMGTTEIRVQGSLLGRVKECVMGIPSQVGQTREVGKFFLYLSRTLQ